jgi:DNA-binding transcriptional LysR family regulator
MGTLDHACIRFKFPSGAMPPWEFLRNDKAVKLSPQSPLVANRIDLQLAAAAAGLGVIHAFEGFVAPAVARGELCLILEEWSERFSGPYLYYASRRHMPGPLRAFVDFIKADAKINSASRQE